MEKLDIDKIITNMDELSINDSLLATTEEKEILKTVISNAKKFCQLLYNSHYSKIMKIDELSITNYLTVAFDLHLNNGDVIYIEIGKSDMGFFVDDEDKDRVIESYDFAKLPTELIDLLGKMYHVNE